MVEFEKIMLIGYWPMLDYSKTTFGKTSVPNLDELTKLLNTGYSNLAHACLWLQVPTKAVPIPVLAYDKAGELYNHIKTWSDGSPGERFDLVIAHDAGDNPFYAVAIWPRDDKCITRFKASYLRTNKKVIPDKVTFEVLAQPLIFTAKSAGTISKLIETDSLPKPNTKHSVYLIDTANVQIAMGSGRPPVYHIDDLYVSDDETRKSHLADLVKSLYDYK